MFNLEQKVDNLESAPYNPREIDDGSLKKLKQSILKIGFVKPVIVTEDGIIVAGHQRIKVSRELELKTVPAFILKNINIADEVGFNQLHNGTDLDYIDHPVTVDTKELSIEKFLEILPDKITGNFRSSNSAIRKEICGLLVKYGNWGCAVVNKNGEVISSSQYLLSCKIMGIKARIFILEGDKASIAKNFFAVQYGVFNYDHLEKDTWIQSFAQPFRLRKGKGKRAERKNQRLSPLYETMVLPYLKKEKDTNISILDFGSGQGDYVKYLKSKGHSIIGVEFFFRRKHQLDTRAVHKMCNEIEQHLLTKGRFDIVVCDVVLNSTDSEQAEKDVLESISALCKLKGRIYYSGKRLEYLINEYSMSNKIGDAGRRYVHFLDKDNRSGSYMKGSWFYQKWHSTEDIQKLAQNYFNDLTMFYNKNGKVNFQAMSVKLKELNQKSCEESLRNEFDLKWPDNKTVGYGDRIVKAFRKSLEYERCSIKH